VLLLILSLLSRMNPSPLPGVYFVASLPLKFLQLLEFENLSFIFNSFLLADRAAFLYSTPLIACLLLLLRFLVLFN
jgi:hypothetical protein